MAQGTTWRLVAAAALVAAALGCSAHRSVKPAPTASAPAAGNDAATPPAAATPAAVPAPPAAADAPADVDEPGARELEPGEDDTDAPDAATVPEDAEDLLHESMESYRAAEDSWQRGAFDDAFADLDHAYELMVRVDPGDDAVLGQEKEDLRNLISRRIVEIYASRQTAVGDPDRSIPEVVNDDVQREIRSFQGPERDFFLDAYRRSGRYRPMILGQLKDAGLPEQLSWLPLVESGFKDRAFSRARALGLWQFIASTGYRYGLDRSAWIDERMDPEKSTKAALAYLTALHNLFGDWLTALAAYNCGERAVLAQLHHQTVGYFDQFWDLYARLPSETRRYVPRFLAVLAILGDPGKYGFDLPEPAAPVAYETVEVARATKLESLDKALGLEAGTLAELNPELRRNASPDSSYSLKVPPGTGPTVVASLESLPKWDPPAVSFGVHRVRSGETLSAIAARYHTSVGELMRANHLRSANRLSVGQRLEVPVGPGGSSRASSSSASSRTRLAAGTAVQHRVRPGDSLWSIAARYGTTVDRIRADNGLRSSLLHPGQVLTIRAGGS
jgi:membrane-bound lytic murein transglycosylase D